MRGEAKDPAPVRKEEYLFLGIGLEQGLWYVALPGGQANDAPATDASCDRQATHSAFARDQNQYILIGHQVFETTFSRIDYIADARTPDISVGLFQIENVLFDDGQDLFLARQQALQVFDSCAYLPVFFLDSATLQSRQATQLHIEDGLGLDLG